MKSIISNRKNHAIFYSAIDDFALKGNTWARDILATLYITTITPLILEGNLMAEIPTPTTGYSAPAKSRPLGVTILAILLILGAILNLISVPGGLILYGPLYTGYTALIGIINLIIGIALFQMIPWARMAAIIMQVISLVLGLALSVVLGGMLFGALGISIMLMAMLPSIIISLIVIIYLMQGSIKAAFEGTQW